MAQVFSRFFIEEEHAIVSQTYLPWHKRVASAHKRHVRHGVMRSAEGTLTDERRVFLQLACYGVYLCGL